MTTLQIADLINADTVSKKDGVFTVRKGFYYRHGFTSDMLAERIRTAIPTAVVTDHGEVWKNFSGGAPVSRQSHWFVKFTVAA